ncbi:MAG: cytochrome P450 [Caldimonas sp.]
MPTDASMPSAAKGPPAQRYADLPGPPRWPIVGNLLQIQPGGLHRQLEGWAERYGSAFQLRFGRRRVLVMSDHATIGSVLRDRPDRFNRPVYSAMVLREMGLQVGLFSANGDIWRRQRRMVMAGFDPTHVKDYFPSLLRVAQRLQGRWRKAAASGARIDLQADLMRFTVDAIAGLAFGSEVNTLESDDDVIQRHLNQIFPALSRRILAPVRYWRYVKLPADRTLDRSVQSVRAAIEGFIAQARERIAREPERREHPRNLLEAMINAADEGGSGLDDRDVAGNVLVMLLAGEDTTANTLAWLIHFLHANPEVERRARDEVMGLAPDPASYTPETIGALDYVEACAMETMRLKPVAPILPVQAIADTVVAGIEVPAETMIFSLMRRDALAAANFAEPLDFQPERWLAGSPTATLTSAKRISMPFGAGPRICPGRYLALMEMKMAIAMLLASFEIAEVGTADGEAPREHLAFSMGPVGLRMRLKLRAAGTAATTSDSATEVRY